MRRKIGKAELTMPELHLLLTGRCVPKKGNWRDYGEKWLRPFTLISPAGRDELRTLWLENRDTIMSDWKKSGKRGKPWAAKEFEDGY